jgi:hypothetical protein
MSGGNDGGRSGRQWFMLAFALSQDGYPFFFIGISFLSCEIEYM